MGVVGTINAIDLGQPVAKERLYYPMRQVPLAIMDVVLKGGRDPRALVSELRALVASIDPEQPLADVKTLDEWVGQSLEGRRTPTVLLALFGAVALILAAMGIYGVTSYAVSRRTREIGIRVALGAEGRDVMRLLLRQGMMLAAVGVVIGLALAAAGAQVIRSLLYGVSGMDPVTFVAASLLFVAVALIATWLPARRALRVDPITALRNE